MELLRQRIFGLAAGYADVNDPNTRRADAAPQVAAHVHPGVRRAKCSLPTASPWTNMGIDAAHGAGATA